MWISTALLHLLDLDRHRSFQEFYLGVRSQRLSQPQAQEHWDRLLAAESLRDDLRINWSFLGARQVARAYRAAVTPAESCQTHSAGEDVSFGGLYISILLGRLSVHQLKQRPLPRAWGAIAQAGHTAKRRSS